jgi:hypothetical protein
VYRRLSLCISHLQGNQKSAPWDKLNSQASRKTYTHSDHGRPVSYRRRLYVQVFSSIVIAFAATFCLAQEAGHDVATDAASVPATEMPESKAIEPPTVSVKPADFNEDIYYKYRLDYSQQLGVLPVNIPFVFDVFVGGDYSQKPLHYTLMPIMPSIRWQVGKISGPWFLRGNTDITASLPLTFVIRGPEHRYGAFALGFRRNFVYRNWHSVPYFDFRAGAGFIDAQEPHGVKYAQGEDYTFTLIMGSGVRYSFNPKWSMELGMTYMHVSNLYLSEPKYPNNGINVYGPIIGFNKRLGRPKHG